MAGEFVEDRCIWSQVYLIERIDIVLMNFFSLLLSKGLFDRSLSFLELGDVADVSSRKFAREVVLNFIDADFGLENRCW